MAADIHRINCELVSFFNFAGKSVLHVGAGGGQIIEYATVATRVLAVDTNPVGVARLERVVASRGLKKVAARTMDFYDVTATTDVVLFEFCLHEMDNPRRALSKAFEIAPQVVVIDHYADSAWAFYTSESDKLRRSWSEVSRFPIVDQKTCEGSQRFRDFNELWAKVGTLPEPSLAPFLALRGRYNIEIAMWYTLAWLERT